MKCTMRMNSRIDSTYIVVFDQRNNSKIRLSKTPLLLLTLTMSTSRTWVQVKFMKKRNGDRVKVEQEEAGERGGVTQGDEQDEDG